MTAFFLLALAGIAAIAIALLVAFLEGGHEVPDDGYLLEVQPAEEVWR